MSTGLSQVNMGELRGSNLGRPDASGSCPSHKIMGQSLLVCLASLLQREVKDQEELIYELTLVSGWIKIMPLWQLIIQEGTWSLPA